MDTTGFESDEHSADKKNMMHRIKASVHQRLIEMLDLDQAQNFPVEHLHRECSAKIDALLMQEKYPLTGPEKK